MNTDSESARETLDWQAYRYIANEMSSQEHSDFELLLAEDQTAREAVASVVELTQTIYAAELFSAPHAISPAPITRSPVETTAVESVHAALRAHNWLVPAGWISVGAVACLVLVFVGSATDSTHDAGHSSTRKASVELAEAWSAQTLNKTIGELEETILDSPASWKEEQSGKLP